MLPLGMLRKLKIFYDRLVLTAATAILCVQIPAQSVVRRVEAHVITLPSVYPDTSAAIVDLCSLIEDDTTDAGTWLFGQEPIQGRRPLAWQGELHTNLGSRVWCYFVGGTIGNQVELGVTID